MKSGYHHGALRDALIDIGLRLLSERQAEPLSLREMARAAGVSPTAVYRHFPDKDALMSALAQEGLARLGAAQHAAYEAAGGGEPGFAATGRAYVRFALANPALFRLIYSFPAPPDLLERDPATHSDAMAFLKSNAAARASPDTDPDVLRTTALRAWALAHGLAMLLLDGQAPATDAVIDAVLKGAR